MAKKETMHLELPGANLKEFSLGDTVTAQVSGKLIELSSPRELDFGPGDSETLPASVGIEIVGKAKLMPKEKKPKPNAFADMAAEDDEEGD